jgi:hypothetical protein
MLVPAASFHPSPLQNWSMSVTKDEMQDLHRELPSGMEADETSSTDDVGGDALPSRRNGALSRRPRGRQEKVPIVPVPVPVAAEDKVMYSFFAGLIILIAFFFAYVSWIQSEALLQTGAQDKPMLLAEGVDNDPGRIFLDAQYRLITRRYNYAAAATVSNAARTNTAFLIGTVLVLSGCLMLVRRVRESAFDASWDVGPAMRSRLISSSPGLVLAFLGATVVVSTLIIGDRVKVEDSGITALPSWWEGAARAEVSAMPPEVDSILKSWEKPLSLPGGGN